MERKRVIYLDLVRILCVFSMIMLHTASSNWRAVPPDSAAWQAFNLYDSLVRFCVPLFVMISGALFLDPAKSVTLGSLLKRNIPRVACAYLFWSACYAFYTTELWKGFGSGRLSAFGSALLRGHFHLWFLFVIVGLYLMVPFLRRIAEDFKLMEYFLFLAFLFTFLPRALSLFPGGFPAAEFLDRFQVHLVLGYAGYFVAGRYFSIQKLSAASRWILAILGAGSLLFTILMTSHLSVTDGIATDVWYSYLTPNTAFYSVALFVLIRYGCQRIPFGKRSGAAIETLSICSFGMYLIHAFAFILLSHLGISTLSAHPIFTVPAIALAIFALSFCVSFLLNKIPVVNRYLM